MKHQADSHRTEKEYAIGDLVYLKQQPHIQSSVAPRSNQKLAFRYYGPFPILQRIGAVAYRLKLPDHAQIHPVVHVSQLKRHVPPQVEVSTDLSTVCTDPDDLVSPVAIVERAFKGVGGATSARVRVQWNFASRLLSWEDEADLRRRFPKASAWGQAAFQGGENVMTKHTSSSAQP